MYEGLNFDQESFYLCMNCHKIYNENPQACIGKDGKVHSRFVDMAKFLGNHPKVRSFATHESILRFDIGQIENLDFITPMGNTNLQSILEEKGFKTIAEISTDGQNEEHKSPKKFKQKVLSLVSNLNKQGENYFVFSNSFMGGYTGYTFMKSATLK